MTQYTLIDGTPVTVQSRHVVSDPQSDYYGQEMVQVTTPLGERDWIPAAELVEIRPARRDNRPPCHYCGMPANATGFFGEPVCRECGG